jgi:hypothetical protein
MVAKNIPVIKMNFKRERIKPLVTALIIAGLIFVSCEKYSYEIANVDPDVPVYFQAEIQPIFTRSCIVCHKGVRDPDLRDGKSYNALNQGGYVNLPVENSKLYVTIESSGHRSFTLPEEKQKIFYWIKQGANNN